MTHQILPLQGYDHIIVSLSGGKDSVACLLFMIEQLHLAGIPLSRLEAWHQDVDGHGDVFMDWPCTPSYCQALCDVLGVQMLSQWRMGGFEMEMCRDRRPTAPVKYQIPHDDNGRAGGDGPVGTRRKFPQVSGDLSVRWCSAYLKIDVARRALCNDPRFKRKRILFVTGERWEESAKRSTYLQSEPHATHLPQRAGRREWRHVDHYRPVLAWKEGEVWAMLEKHRINPHPCYWLGFGRASCRFCIFGDAHQFATGRDLAPIVFNRIARYESEFGVTIHRGETIVERANRGVSYIQAGMEDAKKLSKSLKYPKDKILTGLDDWRLPPGAFKHCGGPS